MSDGILVLTAVLIANGFVGAVWALDLWASSRWMAQRGANIPSWLRLPGQNNSAAYRVIGALMAIFSASALMWIALSVYFR